MATRLVTGTLLRVDGSAWVGGQVYFDLVDDAFTVSPDRTYPKDRVIGVADSSGAFSVTLTSDLDQVYQVTLPDRETFLIAVSPGPPVTLEVLRAGYVGIPNPIGPPYIGPTGLQGPTGPIGPQGAASTVPGPTGPTGGGLVTPPGANTQVIFNDGGAFGADAGFTYNKATDLFTLAGLAGAGTRLVEASSAGLLSATHRPIGDLLSIDSFSGAAAVTIDSRSLGGGNLFQADYDHYETLLEISSFAVAGSYNIWCRLRAAGADMAAGTGFTARTSWLSDGSQGFVAASSPNAAVIGATPNSGQQFSATIRFYNPLSPTLGHRLLSAFTASGAVVSYGLAGGHVSGGTAYSGLKFFPDSTTISGVAYTYGLRRSV